jgi:hypothetical protein
MRCYGFYTSKRDIGSVNAAPHWKISDLMALLLISLHDGGRLPGCLSLRFWDVELSNGTTIGDYQILNGAALAVADADTRDLTITPGNDVIKAGAADTVTDLKLFLAREERLRLKDFTLAANGEIADGRLLWSVHLASITVLYEPINLTFVCGEESITVTLPTNATLSDLRSSISSEIKKRVEFITFLVDEARPDLEARMFPCLKDLAVTIASAL